MLRNLNIKPVKDKGINKPHYPEFEEHYIHQADLLFLPHDNDFKYTLVVVDLGVWNVGWTGRSFLRYDCDTTNG